MSSSTSQDLTAQIEALEVWHRQHGGFLHLSIKLSHSPESGIHWLATASISPQTLILSVPHQLSLSYLNALADETYPFFKLRRNEFDGVEAIGFWYLMLQWLNRKTSFWRTYLDLLPHPDSEFSTPLFFEDEDDLKWIEETDVLHSARNRLEVYEKQFRKGIEILRSNGIDTEKYTWKLYKWAVTMFTSRSFSSRVIRPTESKYWTTFRTGPNGRRQTVLLDMSGVSAEDLDFPILFPTMDAGNHDPKAPVDWAYDPGRFTVTVGSPYEAGQEVFNNYSALKSNGELLLGYGFCLPENPADVVMLTLKAPPLELRRDLRSVHPGYFLGDGEWNSDKATFYLPRMKTLGSTAAEVMANFPEPLLELLLYMLRHDRGMRFTFIDHPLQFLTTENSPGQRILPHIARAIAQSLMPKLQKLQAITLPERAHSYKQQQAALYRQGQIDILSDAINILRKFTRSYFHFNGPHTPRLVTLEGLFEVWSHYNSQTTRDDFQNGIAASAGTASFRELVVAGWEDEVFVLMLCSIVLHGSKEGVLNSWLERMVPDYIDLSLLDQTGTLPQDVSDGGSSPAHELLRIVRHAAASSNEDSSMWKDARWSAKFITEIGGTIFEFDSMTMMVPSSTGADASEEARVVVYLHSTSL